MPKIGYGELLRMLNDPSIPEEQLRQYLTVDPRSTAFDPIIIPDPATVEISEMERDAASAMRIGNGLARWRRHRRFKDRLARGETLPILVSEGDSWFQFPFLITDVVDHLGDEYLIWSLDAAGDTAINMVRGRPEYLQALREQRGRVAAFLFSAAGNDIIGEDENQRPMLEKLLKTFESTQSPEAHIDHALLSEILAFLRGCYQEVIDKIRAEADLGRLPIILHGYDYPLAYPFMSAENDLRAPHYAAKDEWLGSAFSARGIVDPELRRDILIILIDALYDMLNSLAGDSAATQIYVVDVRGTLKRVGDWNDEIHGTDKGFAAVADKFRATLHSAIQGRT